MSPANGEVRSGSTPDELQERENQQRQEERRRKSLGRQSYNYDETSPFQVLGTGNLSERETDALIREKGKLVQP